jgi:predicted permease
MLLDSNWRRELFHAARRLWKTPGFAAVAVITLAIGVGVNAAMFSLIDSLLFRPPAHVVDPDRVVRVQFTRSGDAPGDRTPWSVSNYPAFEDAAATHAFDAVAAYYPATVSIGRGVEAYEASAMIVSPAFFRVLGVRPHAGSLLGSTGADTVADNGVVLSYGFWERQFGRDPRVVGAPIVVGASSYVVAGVAPNDFSALQDKPADLWLPMNDLADGYLASEWRTRRGSFWLSVVARLPAAATARAVEARVGAVLQSGAQDRRAPTGIVTAPLVSSRGSAKSREVRVAFWLAGVSAFVLLIACANIANLVVARNISRSGEYAIRLSLGASGWQLRRQLIADMVVLGVPGLIAALFVGYAVRATVPAFLPADVPTAGGLFDARSLPVIVASGLLAVVLVAAVSLAQVRPATIVRNLTTRIRDDRRGGARTRAALLALQSALCVCLLFGAGLFARSLSRLLALDLGVELDRTVQLSFRLPRGARTPEQQRALYERALERLRADGAVERAALAGRPPYQAGMGIGPFTAERTQRELWEGKGEVAYESAVGAGFFRTVGAASLRGRDFTDADRPGAPLVVILNRNLTLRLWPDGDALGRCVFLYEDRGCYRVVGVLGGVWKFRALDRSKMTVYLPLAQTPDETPQAVLVRTRGLAAGAVLAQLRSEMQRVEPDLPAVEVSLARDLVAPEFRPWRLGATLFGGFSAIALVIAAVGLFGVVSFTMTLRTREIGIRMALGARGSNIARVVAGAGIGAVVTGLVLGSAASLIGSRWMGDVLYQTSPRDSAVLAGTAVVLLVVAAIAVIVPIVRALRLPPAAVLRAE